MSREQPDARAYREPQTAEEWRAAYFVVLKRATTAEAEILQLREQLDALREAATEVVDGLPQFDYVGGVSLLRLRAALGDVAAAETSGSALDQRAVESRGGES